MSATAVRAAVEAKDIAALAATLADDVVFWSPAVFRPYEGREAVLKLLTAVGETFEDFRYTDVLEREGAAILVFRARVGSRELEGIDYLQFGERGLVREFTVMVRPLSGLAALAEAVGARLAAAP